jgi:hypothetical protein
MPMTGQEQYDAKIRLENTFKPEIKRLFNTMLSEFRVVFAIRGMAPLATNYLSAWEQLLDIQYKRTQKVFSQADKQEEEDGINEELLLLALLTWRTDNKEQQSKLISNTNRKQMREAIEQARLEFDLQGVLPTNIELALASTVILKKKFAGRVTNIAMSETQGPAESTKFIKEEVKAGVRPTILGGSAGVVVTATKTWNNRGDGKVRVAPFNHKAAGGQTVNLLAPFVVSDELLNYPKDTSLGASLGNVAGCRCWATYLA